MKKYDIIINGAGVAGCACAAVLRNKFPDKKILIIEKTNTFGGAAADERHRNSEGYVGLKQKYGIHLLYTNNDKLVKFLKNYDDLVECDMTASTKIDGRYIPLPINFYTFDEFFDEKTSTEIKEYLLNIYNYGDKVRYSELKEKLEKSDFKHSKSLLYLLKRMYGDYSAKQWGTDADDNKVVDRVLFVIGYTKNYYPCKYYYLPKAGYTNMFHSMTSGCDVKLNTDYKKIVEVWPDIDLVFIGTEKFNGLFINTTKIDDFYNNKYAQLGWKSLTFKHNKVAKEEKFPTNAIHFPDTYDYIRAFDTRVMYKTEYGYQTFETPAAYNKNADDSRNMPLYTIMTDEYIEKANKYKLLNTNKKVLHLGRAAEYNYYTMDALMSKILTIDWEEMLK